MGNSPVDRSINYMKKVWGTTSLVTDYWSLPKRIKESDERVIQEIMHDDIKREQSCLRE